MNIQALPDKGEKLLKQIQTLEDALSALALSPEQGKMGFAPELHVCELDRNILIKIVFFFFFPVLLFASELSSNDIYCL